ncbi:hypothetical protein [Dysgonomonas sp. 25]|uniref:hypothetical protein n=1 Tax=Dysgonomonas sp. 25 TaxID=2302933 RepID=UPI0013D3A743|nr:hypothetical protein [Dysgonomonas sp. 25]NDV68945.1 hypothetical protein [Dysgonomonas sp. 25]
MKKVFLFLLFIALGSQLLEARVTVTIENKSKKTIQALYVCRSNAGSWGKEVLKGRVIQKGGVFHVELPGTGNWDFMIVDQSGSTFINWYEAIDRNKKIKIGGWSSEFDEVPYIEPGSTWVKLKKNYNYGIDWMYAEQLNASGFRIPGTREDWEKFTKDQVRSGVWLKLPKPGKWKFHIVYQKEDWESDELKLVQDWNEETLHLRQGYNLW